jgi:enamine deaminase RidA (YjgF/YER057c/UK114 family)
MASSASQNPSRSDRSANTSSAKRRKKRNFEFHENRRAADHESFLAHRRFRWLKIALLITLICMVSYLLIDPQPRHNGGSWYGYTLGTIGAGLIVWLSLLGIRKRRANPGGWSLKAWTSAHVYLGLALAVIGTLHTGFQLGWNVHTLAWALMMLVIVSGIYGITAYASLPEKLSRNRREMTREQMVEALAAIDRQLESAAQPLDRSDSDRVIKALEYDVLSAGIWSRLTGKAFRDPTQQALTHIRAPYSPPPNPQQTEPSAEPSEAAAKESPTARVRALLSRRQSQNEQIRRHMRTKALLEIWLYIHIPMTIALIAALLAHIVSVFYYWG